MTSYNYKATIKISATNTSEPAPYNGEESELRDVVQDIFGTNSTNIDISDDLENVYKNIQMVTEGSEGSDMSDQVRIICIQF